MPGVLGCQTCCNVLSASTSKGTPGLHSGQEGMRSFLKTGVYTPSVPGVPASQLTIACKHRYAMSTFYWHSQQASTCNSTVCASGERPGAVPKTDNPQAHSNPVTTSPRLTATEQS